MTETPGPWLPASGLWHILAGSPMRRDLVPCLCPLPSAVVWRWFAFVPVAGVAALTEAGR